MSKNSFLLFALVFLSASFIIVAKPAIAVSETPAIEQHVDMTISLTSTMRPLTYQRLFDVDLVYAYVQPGSQTARVILNFTSISNISLPAVSGVSDVYTVQVLSNGQIVNSEGAVGVNIGKVDLGSYLLDLAMELGHFGANSRTGLKDLEVSFKGHEPNLVEPISISVVWMGWITVDNGSPQAALSFNQTIQNVQLQKYQNGFLYNNLVAPENLWGSGLLNLSKPFNQTYPTSTTLTSSPIPSATQEPGSSVKLTPALTTTLIVVSVVSIAVVAVSALVYYKKRKLRQDEIFKNLD